MAAANKNPNSGLARTIARVLSGVTTSDAFAALPEAKRKSTMTQAWQVVGAIEQYNKRKKKAQQSGSDKSRGGVS